MRVVSPIYVNVVLAIIILLGFAGNTALNISTTNTVIERDIENIVKLTCSSIYSEIDINLTKPIYVSSTIASDSFLKRWLREEKAEDGGETAARRQLIDYLRGYKNKYDYNSFSIISAKTGNYYHFNGLHKTISPQDPHDVWYYGFVAKNLPYALNIDTDEADENILTVFVDSRIEDEDGTLLGVTGVGVKMRNLQNLLKRFESEYTLRAFLVDSQGMVRVHTDSGHIGKSTLADLAPNLPGRANVLAKDRATVLWYPDDTLDACLNTSYIAGMDWFLVVDKNTRDLRMFYRDMIRRDLVIALAVTVLATLLATILVFRYNRLILTMANTDELTRLPNRKAFNVLLRKFIARLPADQPMTESGLLFFFDIDDFKKVNDSGGHLFGNEVLEQVADLAKKRVGAHGEVARWGGDEFAGFLHGPYAEARKRLAELARDATLVKSAGKSLSISVGATRVSANDQPETLFRIADSLLYTAKADGKNRICFGPGEV